MFQIKNKNYKWWITATMGLIIFILCVDWTIVSLAIPTIAVSLHSSLSELQWILNGYALTCAMFMILGGKLADHYGKRVILIMGVFIFTLSSISEKQSNVATGIFYTIGFLGGIVGIAVSGIMLSALSMRWLQAEIVKQGIQISKSNWQILINAANGSHPVNRLPNYFPNKLAEKLVPIVQHSFLHAYAAIMLLCAFFMLLSLLMTVLIKP